MIQPGRVAVAMSGGVDSAVAAALLVEQGWPAFGIMLRLWSAGPELPNRCCSPRDMAMARRVAAQLDLPFYVLDVRQRFHEEVVQFFVEGYAQGVTPNPCMECNRSIRWQALLQHALGLGATHLATGHYARVEHQDGAYRLRRGVDRNKDQSYVLSVLGQAQLTHALFPLGDLTKVEVREVARRLGLPVAERPESQDLCFAGGSDYRSFLHTQAGVQPLAGPILDTAGRQVGTHPGLSGYTIGQRKGIGISSAHPLYVVHKDPARNALVVGPRLALGRDRFTVRRVNWVSAPPAGPIQVEVQVRYRAAPAAARVQQNGHADEAVVSLEQPLYDVTPGQAAVFYSGDQCLGGGIIQA
jgi:tRNA-specific 2-thiouridylase